MDENKEPLINDDMFLVDVEDPDSGETFSTLSISRTPAMLLSFAANKFTEAASKYFNESLGLGTVDWRMLLLLARTPGVTSVQAAQTIGVDKGTVSRSVSRLSKNELIQLGVLHSNGRSRGLTLTPTGRVLHDRILAAALSQQAHLLVGFDPEEVSTLCNMLLRFMGNLDALIERDRS